MIVMDQLGVQQLLHIAIKLRQEGKVNDPRYVKVIGLLKNHKEKLSKSQISSGSKESTDSANGHTPQVLGDVSRSDTSSQKSIMFTEQQLQMLQLQIKSYRSLCQSLDNIVNEVPMTHQLDLSSSTSLQPEKSLDISSIGNKNIKVSESEISGVATLAAVSDNPLEPVSPKWKRKDRDMLYLGPCHLDGDRIPIPKAGFGPFDTSNWKVALDKDSINDIKTKRKQKRVYERQQQLNNSMLAIHKRFAGKKPDQKVLQQWNELQLESLAIKCLTYQQDLRKQVLASYRDKLAQAGQPLSIDRRAFRRIKKPTREEVNELERETRKKRIKEEKERRQQHQVFLNALVKHSRDFFSFHRAFQSNITKAAKAVKSIIDQRTVKAEREEDKQEKLRLKALKANDMEAYTKLVAEAKNERLTYLLSQTSHYLDNIRELVRGHRVKHGISNTSEDGDLDYLGIIQHGSLPKQPLMLVGGDLKEYQLRGLQWMVSLYENRLNGILADEMGLGKTIQSIALVTYIMEIKRNNGPFLVVVPLSTLSNWVNEFKKWAPDCIIVVYKGSPPVRKEIYRIEMLSCQFNVLLTTYEYIMKDKAVLKKYEWQYIIVDEGHRMKNAQSKFAQTLGSTYKSRNRLLLTGTPLQNSLPELWALLNFLLPTIFSSVDNFEQWFSKPFAHFSGTGETNELSDEERMLIINRLHQVLRPFLLRRVKSTVMDQLPDKTERILKCDLSGWQKILYRRIQEGGALLVNPNSTSKQSKPTVRGLSNIIMQLRKVCNHPYLFLTEGYHLDFRLISSAGKFELLDRMLPKLKAAGHRVLMFSQMTQLMHVLEDYFVYRQFKYLRLDGSTTADEREQRMFMFNAADSPYFLFLLSTRAGGLGLNLATADTVILFDSDWNPAMDAQAQDRAHRIGQKNEVRVFRLVTNTPIEEKILSRATDKMNMNNLIVEAGKFNNRSKEAERKAMLESLLKLESEDNDTENVLDDDQLNEFMALTEEELALYTKMDSERIQSESREWEARKKRENLKPDLPYHRLMQEWEVPEWLKKADKLMDEQLNDETLSNMTEGPRKRKEISYRGLTESEFLKMVDSGADAEEMKAKIAQNHERREEKRRLKLEKKARLEEKAVDETPPKRSRESGVITDAARGRALGKYLKKVFTAVKNTTDSTGRRRSDIFLVKPLKKELPDYYEIIKNPMDLDTIKKRLDRNKYTTTDAFDADFALLFGNAQTYNHPDSWVYQDSLALDKVYQEKMESIRQIDVDDLVLESKSSKPKKKRKLY